MFVILPAMSTRKSYFAVPAPAFSVDSAVNRTYRVYAARASTRIRHACRVGGDGQLDLDGGLKVDMGRDTTRSLR